MRNRFTPQTSCKCALHCAGLRVGRHAVRSILLAASVAWAVFGVQSIRPQTPPGPAPIQVPPQWDLRHLIANAEAADTPDGSKAYAQQLAEMLISPRAGNLYIDAFTGRLFKADMLARRGEGQFISESAVAHAFNKLMSEVHSPLRTDTNVVHALRNTLYALSPALGTVNSNSSECLPSEAVDLMAQLVEHNGSLEDPCSPSIPPGHRCVEKFNAAVLISRYTQSHSPSRNAELFDHVAKIFGI